MSLPSRVVLHVGMTKAGSTLIQNFLESRYDTLRSHGWLFPRSVFSRKDPTDPTRTPGHLELVHALRTGDLTHFETECRESEANTLILSAENLMNHRRLSGLDRLADLLAGCYVHVVVLVREQTSWLVSRYYESVSKGFHCETRPFERFCQDLAVEGALDYSANISDLATRFGAAEVSVLDFDLLAMRGTVLQEFLEASGCPLKARPEDEMQRVNVSRICPEAIEAHRRLNCLAQDLPSEQRLLWSNAMRKHAAALMDEGRLAAAPLLPPASLRRRLLPAMAATNRDLSERWLGCRSFGPDGTWADRPETAIDREALSDLLREGFGFLAEHLSAKLTAELPCQSGWPRPTHNPDEAALLESAVTRAGIVLVDRAAADTVLIAAMEGKLVHVLSPDRAAAIDLQLRIDIADLPSPPIVHLYENGIGVAISEFWLQPTSRHPDLILLTDPAGLGAICVSLTRPTTLILDSARKTVFRDRNGTLLRPRRRAGRLAEYALVPGLTPVADTAAAKG